MGTSADLEPSSLIIGFKYAICIRLWTAVIYIEGGGREKNGEHCSDNALPPPDKASDLGPIAIKITPTLPKYIKRVGDSPYATATETDYMNIAVYDIEDAKAGEAVKELTKYYHQLCAVPGFRWAMYNALPLKDALPIIGLEYPTPK